MALRTRLVAATILVALAALVIAGVATYAAFVRSQLRQIDDTLQGTHEPIEQAVAKGSSDMERAIEDAAPGTFIALERPMARLTFRFRRESWPRECHGRP